MQVKQMIFRFLIVLTMGFAVAGVNASNGFAADLRSAKASGLIGEQPDGYLGIVSAAPEDVRALVTDINKKRQAVYRKIAAKNGISLKDVELMAGKKAIAKTAPGAFIRTPSGEWVKK